MPQLEKGQPAPDFKAPDQDENTVSLSDADGKMRFLFFYPKANTSG
jgi:peroxiredoxin Q/BCP